LRNRLNEDGSARYGFPNVIYGFLKVISCFPNVTPGLSNVISPFRNVMGCFPHVENWEAEAGKEGSEVVRGEGKAIAGGRELVLEGGRALREQHTEAQGTQ
jgi:hypothetical protein